MTIRESDFIKGGYVAIMNQVQDRPDDSIEDKCTYAYGRKGLFFLC